MLVPLYATYSFPVFASGALILTPGALTSGFILPSLVGPLEENGAISLLLSIAPTVIMSFAEAGIPTVFSPGPAFPAATTITTPICIAVVAAISTGVVPSLFKLAPKLILITSIPYLSLFCTAHSIPSITSSNHPLPHAFNTLTPTIFAPGATPLNFPSLPPVPAAIPETCVPCPLSSYGSVLKLT